MQVDDICHSSCDDAAERSDAGAGRNPIVETHDILLPHEAFHSSTSSSSCQAVTPLLLASGGSQSHRMKTIHLRGVYVSRSLVRTKACRRKMPSSCDPVGDSVEQ